MEIGLRHLSAYIYESRTHDHVGAAKLRAVTAPGSNLDVAPGWPITDATSHSIQEHKRSKRVEQELKKRNAYTDSKGKGKGKGKKGKD